MASSKDRERKLARAKIDRQQARRAHQVQGQRQVQARIGAAVAIIVVAAVVGVATHWYGITKPKPTPIAQCVWTPASASSNPDLKNVGTPPTKGLTMTGQQTMTITTNQGTIDANIEVTQAPCTAASFTYLASKKFFDNTNCHRLTTAGLFVLQCGDPSGTGSGGPTYTIPDENIPLTDDVGAASAAPSAPTSIIYKAGTVAMANTGQAGSGSSQFFLVYKDSTLPANYPEIGTISADGLAVINKIAAGGVASGGSSASDGPPKITTTIQSFTMSKITPVPTPSASATPSTPATPASPSSNS